MPRKNETVSDTTDMGPLRLDEPAIRIEGTESLPLAHPYAKHKNRPVDSYGTFELFQLFSPDEQIQILVDNTNKYAKKACKGQSAHGGGTDRERKKIREWILY